MDKIYNAVRADIDVLAILELVAKDVDIADSIISVESKVVDQFSTHRC